MNQHTNDGTLTPQMADWLRRYHGSQPWILDIVTRASVGVAPMPYELRLLENEPIVATARGGWQSEQDRSL